MKKLITIILVAISLMVMPVMMAAKTEPEADPHEGMSWCWFRGRKAYFLDMDRYRDVHIQNGFVQLSELEWQYPVR